MRKIIIPILAACVMFASCADDLKYTDKNGEEKVAKTYGWADYQENHADGIVYRVNIPKWVFNKVSYKRMLLKKKTNANPLMVLYGNIKR